MISGRIISIRCCSSGDMDSFRPSMIMEISSFVKERPCSERRLEAAIRSGSEVSDISFPMEKRIEVFNGSNSLSDSVDSGVKYAEKNEKTDVIGDSKGRNTFSIIYEDSALLFCSRHDLLTMFCLQNHYCPLCSNELTTYRNGNLLN